MPKRLLDEQSAAAAKTVAKKPRRSSRSTATATAAAAAEKNDAPDTTAMNDNYETYGAGENAAVSVICILEDIDFHEAESGSALTEFNAERDTELDDERDTAAKKYSLYSQDDDSDDIQVDLDTFFQPPNEESYKEPEEKFHFFELCQAKDGKENKQRCVLGLEKMSGYVRSCIGFFGASYNFALYAEKVPGSGQWLNVRYCSTLAGNSKHFDNEGVALGAPGSLVHSAGGRNNVANMDPGETRDHRKDAHNRVIFRVQRIDVRVVSIEQIKKEAAENVDVWKAALARLDMANTINGNPRGSGHNKGYDQMFYSVTKEDDEEYGTRVVKSLQDLMFGPNGKVKKGRGDIGQLHYQEGKVKVKLSDLPSNVGDAVRITTKKKPERNSPPVIGTYVVTRISPEDYCNAMKLV